MKLKKIKLSLNSPLNLKFWSYVLETLAQVGLIKLNKKVSLDDVLTKSFLPKYKYKAKIADT